MAVILMTSLSGKNVFCDGRGHWGGGGGGRW